VVSFTPRPAPPSGIELFNHCVGDWWVSRISLVAKRAVENFITMGVAVFKSSPNIIRMLRTG